MKILLTGAAGFTGVFFKSAAEAAGHQVVALQANLTDKAAVAADVLQAEPDAVVHLAAISFVGHADDTAFYGVNVVGTMNLLAGLAALPVKPRKVLLASSANVYGNVSTEPITESQTLAPENDYAVSKLAMEKMAYLWGDTLPITITRPFNYTGRGQSNRFLIPKIVDHFKRREKVIELGNVDVYRDFSDVRNVAWSYGQLAIKPAPGEIFNISSGTGTSILQVLSYLEELTGHRMEISVNPKFVREHEVRTLTGDSSKLWQHIGHPDKISIRQTLQWMLDEK